MGLLQFEKICNEIVDFFILLSPSYFNVQNLVIIKICKSMLMIIIFILLKT